MKIGLVGLGRMGMNMARRLTRGGHTVIGCEPVPAVLDAWKKEGGQGVGSLAELVAALEPPRAIWIMVPLSATESVLAQATEAMAPGDVLIDGGNSNWKDSMRRAAEAAKKGLEYVDAGTSGGIWGLENGYCLMVGGTTDAVDRIAEILTTLAPPEGWLHVGPSGAGHYTKMIHNGIEYGMLQSYAEGFELMHASEFGLDLRAVSKLWNRGSVVRSWLLELAERAFEKNGGDLDDIRGYVEDSGEGRWTVQDAIDRSIPAPVITLSLLARFSSRQPESFSAKMIAALRNEFGGHAIKK
jgi:6-phosphogluconate dehydrogenase